jgi:pimeloyl-ACP methyl ester carboxylesterase
MIEPDLHVFEAGCGEPVVLIHGLPSPPADLEALAHELPGRRVLVPHLPGYGATPPAPGSQGAEAVEAALLASLHLRGVVRPTLVGYSMGAYRALSLARRIEARAVVCLAGFLDLSAEERAGMAGAADMLRAGVDIKSSLPARFLSAEHRALRPGDERLVEQWAEAAPPATLVEELHDLAAAPSLLARVAELTCPIYARTGELDVATPPAHARAIASAAQDGHLQIVPGVAHALLLEDRAGTVAALRRACGLQATYRTA